MKQFHICACMYIHVRQTKVSNDKVSNGYSWMMYSFYFPATPAVVTQGLLTYTQMYHSNKDNKYTFWIKRKMFKFLKIFSRGTLNNRYDFYNRSVHWSDQQLSRLWNICLFPVQTMGWRELPSILCLLSGYECKQFKITFL